MKDFYEILGLKSKATKDEIKKSYFNLVRKYPLDIYELEFMEIRRAYETLSNDKIRKQYDLIPLLPMEMKESYNSAMILFDEGDFANGIKILEKILKSNAELVIIKLFLAEAYLKNNNIGKAIKAYEKLTIEEPENAAFAGYLAETYLTRGWQKKAIETYNKAINLDCDNISLWIGLSDAYIKNNEYEQAKEVLENVLNKGTENSDSTTIYSNLIMIDIGLEIYSSIDRYLDKFRELSANYPETKDNAAWTLANIAELLLNIERVDEAKKVIDVSIEFSSEEGRILEIKEKIDNFDDGHNPFVREEPKIGRNDPCICGSGKKYKKCCGK